MDYDENDFRSQNFQLVGEDSKFPPNLQSFSLPKFDLDEHLQAHLRFDSLVDTDVLLDIQGQDNNWIEDFSSGTSAIEFSSSAANNCTISRHNNVWSEATSSESVEMLLKSVGEDEMNNKKAITMEPDAQNVLSGMIDQINPALGEVDDNSMTVNIRQDDQSVPPDKSQGNLSGQDKGANEVARRSPDSITCMSTPQDPSSVSISGALTGHRILNTPVFSEQVVEKHHAADRSGLLLDDAQEEKSHMLVDAKGSEQLLEGHEVETHLCSGESEPSRDSLVMMAEGCNVTGSSDNSDGLLESIAYQVKALNNDSMAGGRSSTRAEKMNLLETEETYRVDISKDDTLNQMTSHDNKEIVNTSEMSLECYSSTHAISKKQLKETKDENRTEVNPCNLDYQAAEPSFVEKRVEAEVVEESGSKLILSDNVMLGESSSTDLCGNVEVKISSSVPSKLHMAAEPSNVHTSLEVSAGERHAGSSITHDTTNLSNNDIVVMGNAAAAISDGQTCDNIGVTSVLSTKKLVADGSGVGLPSKENTDNCKLNPDGSLVGDEVKEQKEVTLPKELAPDSIRADTEEVKITVTSSASVSNSDSDAQLPLEPVVISDPVVTDHSPPREMTQDVPGVEVAVHNETVKSHQSQDNSVANVESEQNEGVTLCQSSSEFIQSDKKEAKISANYGLAKSGDKTDNRPLAETDIGEISPLNIITKPQSTIMVHPSSHVESSVASQSELQAVKPITHEDAAMIEENLVIHDSVAKGKGKSDRSEAFSSEDKDTIFCESGELLSHGEGQVLPEPPSSVEKTSAAPVNVSMNISATMSRSKEEALFSAVETSKPSLSQLSCGSPTVIGCTRTPQDEPEGGTTDKVKSTTFDSKESTASEYDRSFTFEVGKVEDLSEKDPGNQWKPFSSVQSSDLPELVQSSELPKISKEKSRGRHLESEGKHHGVTAEAVKEDKTSDATRSPNEKLTTPRGKSAKRTAMRKKSVDSIGYSCNTSSAITTSVGTVSNGMQLEEIQRNTGGTCMKTSCSPIVQSSGLPDLNSSTSATSLFHQPFTDLQQVQLRAQIFVYGSLIQSIPPDEACMQSAFGETDGARSSWESVWCKSVERYQSQKSPVNLETPLHSHSAVRAPELETKCSSLQSKAVSASASRSAGKSIAPAILNSPPPLWSMSTHDGLLSSLPRGAQLDFNRALSPLLPYQSSQTRPFPSNGTHWLPQSPRPGPWAIPAQTPTLKASTQYSTVPVIETVQVTPVRDSSMPLASSVQLVSPNSLLPTPSPSIIPPASAVHLETQRKTSSAGNNKNASGVQVETPALKASTQYSTVPVIETVQVTPVRDSSMPHASSVQLVSPNSLLPTPSPSIIPPASAVHLETQRKTSSAGNNKNASGVQKPRKRKKAAVTEDFAETIPISQSTTKPASAIATKIPPSTLQGLSLSANTPSKVAAESIVSTTAHISPTQHQIMGTGNTEQRAIFSEETVNRIEQAKLQAEDAAAVAAAIAASVVSCSEGMWNQLAAQRNSGLVIEVEEKLVSAAAAAAAAASVAKAAAAAAMAASDAVLQAKMMADEALHSAKTGSLTQSSEASFDAGNNLVKLTPGSILRGKDKIDGSGSIISAAREVARRRVEAASAATKRAENLDAIMKAAELAAEAVSQVGTIIAMGDPLPFTLNELVEAGPEGSWKAYRSTSEKISKANILLGKEHRDLDRRDHHSQQMPIPNNEKRGTVVKDGMDHDGQSVPSEDNCQGVGSGVGNPSTIPSDSYEGVHSLSSLKENVIQKGSLVEVISDEDGLRGGWFSARVVDVEDNKAYVCYNNLLSDDGSGQLKEWISLDSETNGAPRIRIAHPLIVTKSDGRRKRQREAVGTYIWAVGDQVDAWMRDGWWEGIVTEESQVDETKLTVYFPAGHDSSLVRAWDLRPSLKWNDGQWIEWSRAKENMLQSQEGDTPQEKRQKVGRVEGKIDAEVDGRVGIPLKRIPPEDSGKVEDSRPINLSAKDMIFSGGKNASEHNISDSLKGKGTSGLQKEGSRVVSGVPKPGKKRKFMKVSKHYDSDKTDKTSNVKDSLKFAKYLMPQASRPWRNTSKMDSKGIRGGASKPVGAKPLKSQTTHARSMTEMGNPSVTNASASNGEKSGHGSSSNMRPSSSNEESYLDKNPLEVVSFSSSLATTESLVAVPTVQPLTTVPPSKKKSSSAVEADKGVKRRFTPTVDKTIKSEKKASDDAGKEIPDSTEPRRSNRRIQPTSRLLEGLQSSMIMSKILTFSHEKGSKTMHRSSSSRGTRG